MLVFHDLDALPDSLRGGAVSVGKFDGMHLGHGVIVQRLKTHAAALRAPSILVTFDPPPLAILRPDLDYRPLCTLERKIELIAAFEPDALVVVHTDADFLRQTAETFFYETLKGRFDARVVVEGRNFSFGRDRIGNVEAIRLYGQWTDVEVDIVESVRMGDEVISSSGIRRLLREGRVERAGELMPQPYRLTGTVVSGERRGRRLGFPTANLDHTRTVIPKRGIYAAVAVLDDRPLGATVHIGPNPTFHEDASKIEVFLHDFSGDLYGKTLHVDFLALLRETIRFDSAEELIEQMNRDVAKSGDLSAARLAKSVQS